MDFPRRRAEAEVARSILNRTRARPFVVAAAALLLLPACRGPEPIGAGRVGSATGDETLIERDVAVPMRDMKAATQDGRRSSG